jgi:L-ribulose-5-phosphate 3-epimerase
MSGLPIGINTFSYIYTRPAVECLRHLGSMGYRDFEILVNQPHFWANGFSAAERREIPRMLSGEGLRIVSANLPGMDNNIVSSTREMRDYTVQQFCDLVDLCGEWQISWVIIVPGRVSPLLPMPRDWLHQYWVDGMTRTADRAKAAGVEILIENVPTTWIPRAQDMMAAIDLLDRHDVGVIYDIANAPISGEDPCEGVRMVKERLRLVHLSDTPLKAWKHDPVGTGELQFADFAGALREIKYHGLSMIELITAEPDRRIVESHARLAKMGWAAR